MSIPNLQRDDIEAYLGDEKDCDTISVFERPAPEHVLVFAWNSNTFFFYQKESLCYLPFTQSQKYIHWVWES
jgi:hypothetical protein